MPPDSTESKIRRGFLEATGDQVFSIVDVIDVVTRSTDPRNYWKVLKNRLKKEQNQLVTKINQLKMESRDGKKYATDVADIETLTEIIKLVPGARINDLNTCLAPFIEMPIEIPPSTDDILPPREPGDAELLIDMYERGGSLFIEAFVAGVEPKDISIETTKRKIVIYGKRDDPKKDLGGEYLIEELAWLSFERSVVFPFPVQTEKIESLEHDGRLVIKIPKFLQ